MNTIMYDSLQLREIFHLEFLKLFSRKVKAEHYAVKGGTNLRLFFKSFRYSEDMDLDARGMSVSVLKDSVMDILQSKTLLDNIKPFGVERITPPDISRAKQTQVTQRFKIHLLTSGGEDLFTKIEFSRRAFKGRVVVESVSDSIMRPYKMAPLVVPHYDIKSAIMQKILALAARSVVQARDIFDIFILCSQYEPAKSKRMDIDNVEISKAYENIFDVSFEQFRDTVVSYLREEDKATYASSALWDDIKLKVANFIDNLKKA